MKQKGSYLERLQAVPLIPLNKFVEREKRRAGKHARAKGANTPFSKMAVKNSNKLKLKWYQK